MINISYFYDLLESRGNRRRLYLYFVPMPALSTLPPSAGDSGLVV